MLHSRQEIMANLLSLLSSGHGIHRLQKKKSIGLFGATSTMEKAVSLWNQLPRKWWTHLCWVWSSRNWINISQGCFNLDSGLSQRVGLMLLSNCKILWQSHSLASINQLVVGAEALVRYSLNSSEAPITHSNHVFPSFLLFCSEMRLLSHPHVQTKFTDGC